MEKEKTVYFIVEQKTYNDRGNTWSEWNIIYDFGMFSSDVEAMIAVNNFCNEKHESVKNYKIVETNLHFGKLTKVKSGKTKFVFD